MSSCLSADEKFTPKLCGLGHVTILKFWDPSVFSERLNIELCTANIMKAYITYHHIDFR